MKHVGLLIRACLLLAIALAAGCGADSAAMPDADSADLTVRDMAVPDLVVPPRDLTITFPDEDLRTGHVDMAGGNPDLHPCLPYDLAAYSCDPSCPPGTDCTEEGCVMCHP